ncbi:hypothetical protein TNCT_417991 [Trichonephila clavata]|uniref:Uncharacterized protein n=1 Tax=Trichonephila clavata TaxID=2740835 RepID=A0A8X6KSA5_TRICU|nr:hypothetical protein TNCT_417991 [Trichonephila clavata]
MNDKKRSLPSSFPKEQKVKRRPRRFCKLYKKKLPSSVPSRSSTKKRFRIELFEKQEDAHRAIPGQPRRTETVDTKSNRSRQVQPGRNCPYHLRSRRPVAEKSVQTQIKYQPYPRRRKGTHIQETHEKRRSPRLQDQWENRLSLRSVILEALVGDSSHKEMI